MQAGISDIRRRLRQIQRAASDLRRGVPVILTGPAPIVILAAETADPTSLQEFATLASGPTLLVLAPSRAVAFLPTPPCLQAAVTAVTLPEDILKVAFLQAVSDPMAPQEALALNLSGAAPPFGAEAALVLAKIGHLLPAVLARSLPPGDGAAIAGHGLIQLAADDILAYGEAETANLQMIASAIVPLTDAPEARLVAFRTHASAIEHFAVVVGQPEKADAPLVRIHSACFTGDLLGSMRCDCGEQLRGGIRRMAQAGSGVLLYLAQEGRGIGLINKLRAYGLQDLGFDTMDANRALGWGIDERNFLVGATMLQQLGIKRIRMLTNNPEKVAAMTARGIEVVEREAHLFEPNGINDDYLATKASRFGHLLDG